LNDTLIATTDADVNGTDVLAAWRAYQRGTRDQQSWDLVGAEREFSSAVVADPKFAAAQLWLAQVASWRRDNDPDSWADAAVQASARRDVLSERDRLLSDGIVALARRQYATACDVYRTLLSRDSLDVVAWLGRGECLSRDPRIVRSRTTASGWAFVASQHEAIRSFLRAIELAPGSQAALTTQRRGRVLYVVPNRVRVGYTSARDTLIAAPSFDLRGDSLSFVPYPYAAFIEGDPRTLPVSLNEAVAQQRRLMLRLARLWVGRSPDDANANEALAVALEVSGQFGDADSTQSAIAAFAKAIQRTEDPRDRMRLALNELRVLVKVGRFANARALADSLILQGTSNPHLGVDLTGVAALRNRPDLAAKFLVAATRSGAQVRDNGGLLPSDAPVAVRDAAAELLAYAALGRCEGLSERIRRVETAIETYVEPRGRSNSWNTMMPRALSLSAPCDSGRSLLRVAAPADRLMRMQQAFARGDLSRLRAMFDTLNQVRGVDRPGDVALDYTYQEAWLSAAMGDTAVAIERLDKALSALQTLGNSVVEYLPQAAALGRSFKLRAEIARAAGDTARANRMRQSLGELWVDPH
jgi:tetratricopeptide (TPR) repeat protein